MSMRRKLAQVITLSTLIFGSIIPRGFSTTVPQEKNQKSNPQTLLAQATAETNKFRFQIGNCERARKEVVCGILVTNITYTNQYISFKIADTRAIDFSGNVYNIQKITLGKDYTKSSSVSTTLTPAIPTKVNYHFAIPQGINQLAGIEFRYYDNNTRKLGLSNISIRNSKTPSDTKNALSERNDVCIVADPTDTTLNVRLQPNGELINSLKNGRKVYIHKIGYDKKKRLWAKIGGYYNGKYRTWGWVFAEYLDCN